ncbi:MAG: citryl-CoA lyase [Polaromonas sp.]|nr:citryl-CoA lyase [Polaromonas sp.]
MAPRAQQSMHSLETAMSNKTLPPIRSSIAWSNAQTINIHRLDLCNDLLGKVDLGDMAFLQLCRRLPTKNESIVFNSLLVSLVEHGITANTISARLTLLGAPESLQGAVAAGLLGLGSTFVGTIEGAARLVAENPLASKEPAAVALQAEGILAKYIVSGEPVPGIGHPIHKPLDPRAERLFEIAREQGLDTDGELLIRAVSRAAEQHFKRVLPVNVTGAIGSITTTLGLPWRITRGLGVMARSIGIVGHLLEEMQQPIAKSIWYHAEEQAESEFKS